MHNNEAKTILDAGLSLAGVVFAQKDGKPFVVKPIDATIESVEEFLPAPTRIEQAVRMHDAASFSRYVNRYAEPGTTIFFNELKKSFLAVLDYHEGDQLATELVASESDAAVRSPRWCQHKAEFTPRTTPEWDAWAKANRITMSQADFAAFIDDHIGDIANDFGPTLRQIALKLEIKSTVNFTSHTKDEQTGAVKLAYEEDVQGTASVGTITIPPMFLLQIQPFVGGPLYKVECRFKYRLVGRAVQFSFEIVQVEKMLESALTSIRMAIEENTGILAFAGEFFA